MSESKTIYFDLDGTVYDLYNLPRWLERITVDYDASAYSDGSLMVDRDTLHALLDSLLDSGYRIGVVSWVAGGNPPAEFVSAIRRTKRAWIRENMPQVSEVHIVKYGTPKYRVVSDPHGILVDDKPHEVGWKGRTIHADNLVTDLKGLAN